MPYYQSNTLKYALCSLSSPERRGGGEVLERVCSKLGGGLEKAIVPVDSSVIPIEGPYTHRAGELQDMVLRNIDCASLNAEYSVIDSHFSIIDDLKTVNNQENDLYFYHSDHLGSSSFITDADGIVSQHLQYLPYGELFAEQRDNTARYYTPYKFSGKEKDEETGYSYFGARYYMPELSIWSAVDPMADKYPHLSPYNYCENNPIMLVDPDGRSSSSPNDYSVDDNGNIKLEKITDDNFDMLYKKSDYEKQNLSNGYKVTDRSVLPALSTSSGIPMTIPEGVPDAETGEQQYSNTTLNTACSKNSNEMIGLFVFVANSSTNAEWRLNKYKSGDLELSTFHDNDESPSDTDLGIQTKSVRWTIHSHPRTKLGGEISSFGSDGTVSTNYKNFFVYFPKSTKLYRLYASKNKSQVYAKSVITNGKAKNFINILK